MNYKDMTAREILNEIALTTAGKVGWVYEFERSPELRHSWGVLWGLQ
jgi:hypothetical protein